MKRKYILGTFLSILLSLNGCSNTITNNNNNSVPFTPTANVMLDNDLETPFILSDNAIYPSPFILYEDSMIFSNPDDKDRISIINYPLPKNYIKTTDVTDFKNYSTNTLTTIGNDVYFANYDDYDTLYSIPLGSNTATKVLDSKVQDLIAIGKTLYYINKDDNYSLYSYTPSTKEKVKLTTDKVGKYLINGNYALFQNISDGSKLYKVALDEKNLSALTNFAVDSFVIYDSKLLVLNSTDDNNLYTVDTNSLDAKRIYLMDGTDLKCHNNKLYFINHSDLNHLYSLSIDFANQKFSSSPIYEDTINFYFPTDKGIFIEKGLNINHRYIYILNPQ